MKQKEILDDALILLKEWIIMADVTKSKEKKN